MVDLNKPGSIERAIALADINALLHAYAMKARDKVNFDEMVQFFRPDALFRLPNGMAVKPTEINKVVQGDEAKYIRHHITTIDIKFQSETEAHTRAQFFTMTELSPSDHWGAWEDIVIRGDDGAWLIADRTIVLEGVAPGGWCEDKYAPFVKRD